MAYKLAREDIYEGQKIPIGFLQVYIFESKLSAKYVMKNYKHRISLDEVAEIVNMTRTSFSRYFKSSSAHSRWRLPGCWIYT